VSGNPGTPSEIVSSPGSSEGSGAADQEPAPRAGSRIRAFFWGTAAGKALTLCTLLALIIRLFVLTRPGFLTGVNEYDDGVYLGAAIKLLQGVMPYHDYALVQPPGIILVAAPSALVAQLTTSAAGLAVARVMTVVASAACVALTGNLVRSRGPLVTAVACGVLALYPDDITSAHTLLLEPWMNLLVLIGVNAAFHDGKLAGPRKLLWAGVAIGAAGSVKYWSIAPALVLMACCLLLSGPRARRFAACLGGLAAGFAIPVLPFAAGAPMAFIRSTIQYQATRTGTTVPLSLRLAHLTGLIDFLNKHSGRFSLRVGANSMFASSSTATPSSSSAGWMPFAAAILIVAGIAIAYTWNPRRPSPLEWFALATGGIASIAMLSYSAFFYHYPAWAAPWIAIVAGASAGLLAGHRGQLREVMAGATAVIVLIALFECYELGGVRVNGISAVSRYIPPGACVVTDEVSLTISSDRFTAAKPGCPTVMDSLATTLVLSGGISDQGGAVNMPGVVAAWESILSKADYVWVSINSDRRLPWVAYSPSSPLWTWFEQHFQQVTPRNKAIGDLWKRDGVTG
jgi:hypothetical protein